jgi:hypothetical protein
MSNEQTLTLRDHEGNVLTLPMAEALALGSYATLGWDYLDANGSWYALRALLPCGRK